MEKRLAVCNLCEAVCGLVLTIEEGQVTGVRGNPDDPLSRGHICPKGVAIGDIHADADRLRRPVRRDRTTGEWTEIGWDEAFDLVADGIATAINEHGKDALAIYLGNPNVHSLGAMTHGGPLVQSFRTRNKFSATSVDQLPHQLIGHLLYGHQLLLPVPDIDRTSYFLVFGANPMASNGSLMTVPDFPARLRELDARGGRMVVFDPRRTETARVASEHHFIRPGTDAWVLLAMLNVLFAEGLTTPPPYVDGLAEVERMVSDFTPAAAERASGVPAEVVAQVAREFAAAETAAAYGRIGVSTQEFGLVCQWAVQLLNLVTGNTDRVGGALLTFPAIDAVGRGLIGRGHFDRHRSRVRQAPEFAGELPVAVLREEIETPGDGQVRALLTLAGNPVLSTPDGAALDRAVEGLDFYAAVDFYINETTRRADVILPPTSHLERDHYDLVFHLLAVRDTARFTPAVFPKGRDQRHDWEIFREINVRVTRRLRHKPSLRRRLKKSARLGLSPTFIIATLLRTGRSGVTITQLRKHPEGVDIGPLRPGQLPDRLFTKDKRIQAAPAIVVGDLARVRGQDLPDEDELLLIGRRHQRDCNSWMHNTDRLTKGRPRHQLLMHPDDLAARGLTDGSLVTVTSRVGSVKVDVQATADMMRGVVSLPHGYGHQRTGVRLGVADKVAGASINDLTDPERLDASGNAALSGVRVTVG
ncbi:molybdopterin-dependent oxidoreductase [Nocardioides bizhenqiangii]|uniref:Molybdopterin-dependent oxidoreductase n=1 Tax=Nocardioides bizhenqiangii TaxID=3095076 RepID=A0ABZ0ZL92_9ACTN|nr:molybdopterin-dependent oxidoreductase [Nocardioides sp. HM61]WQQ25121.1 molybdopterin-dependent oxidoreductase [Nocardioides sp. HM61]